MGLWKDKTDKPLANQEKKERVQINKIRNEKGEIITDITEIQRIVRDYNKKFLMYANEMDNL